MWWIIFAIILNNSAAVLTSAKDIYRASSRQSRIIHAEKLLTETDCFIAEIAGQCGFNDSNYFAAVFKKIKGTTPYKFSKQAGKM